MDSMWIAEHERRIQTVGPGPILYTDLYPGLEHTAPKHTDIDARVPDPDVDQRRSRLIICADK